MGRTKQFAAPDSKINMMLQILLLFFISCFKKLSSFAKLFCSDPTTQGGGICRVHILVAGHGRACPSWPSTKFFLCMAGAWLGCPGMAGLAQHAGHAWHRLAGPAWLNIPRWWTKLFGKTVDQSIHCIPVLGVIVLH